MKKASLLIFVVSIALFLFFRFYQLPQTLNFFGDLGRDFVVMQNWQRTGKPPLLGPQNSAMSFNQSAIYFYLLYPFYLITSGSVYATAIACAGYYVLFFILLRRYFNSNPNLQNKITNLVFLLAVWPSLISQHREIWNPSFVPLAIILAYFSWQEWLKKPSMKKFSWLTALSLSLAMALSYASVPAVVALVIVILLTILPKQRLKFIWQLIITSFLLNLPTLVFELRHNFLLTRSIFAHEGVQFSTYFAEKPQLFLKYLFGFSSQWNLVIFLIILGLCFYLMINKKVKDKQFNFSFIGFMLTSALLLLAPFPIFEHYVIASLTLLALVIAFLPRWRYLMIIVLSLLFLQPTFIFQHFYPTPVSVTVKQACLKQVCSQVAQPIFFNLNSGSHNHQALGYIYLANQAGCQATSADRFPVEQPRLMAVVNEQATFDSEKTAYYELSLFGERELVNEIKCNDQLSVTIFKK